MRYKVIPHSAGWFGQRAEAEGLVTGVLQSVCEGLAAMRPSDVLDAVLDDCDRADDERQCALRLQEGRRA